MPPVRRRWHPMGCQSARQAAPRADLGSRDRARRSPRCQPICSSDQDTLSWVPGLQRGACISGGRTYLSRSTRLRRAVVMSDSAPRIRARVLFRIPTTDQHSAVCRVVVQHAVFKLRKPWEAHAPRTASQSRRKYRQLGTFGAANVKSNPVTRTGFLDVSNTFPERGSRPLKNVVSSAAPTGAKSPSLRGPLPSIRQEDPDRPCAGSSAHVFPWQRAGLGIHKFGIRSHPRLLNADFCCRGRPSQARCPAFGEADRRQTEGRRSGGRGTEGRRSGATRCRGRAPFAPPHVRPT